MLPLETSAQMAAPSGAAAPTGATASAPAPPAPKTLDEREADLKEHYHVLRARDLLVRDSLELCRFLETLGDPFKMILLRGTKPEIINAKRHLNQELMKHLKRVGVVDVIRQTAKQYENVDELTVAAQSSDHIAFHYTIPTTERHLLVLSSLYPVNFTKKACPISNHEQQHLIRTNDKELAAESIKFAIRIGATTKNRPLEFMLKDAVHGFWNALEDGRIENFDSQEHPERLLEYFSLRHLMLSRAKDHALTNHATTFHALPGLDYFQDALVVVAGTQLRDKHELRKYMEVSKLSPELNEALCDDIAARMQRCCQYEHTHQVFAEAVDFFEVWADSLTFADAEGNEHPFPKPSALYRMSEEEAADQATIALDQIRKKEAEAAASRTGKEMPEILEEKSSEDDPFLSLTADGDGGVTGSADSQEEDKEFIQNVAESFNQESKPTAPKPLEDTDGGSSIGSEDTALLVKDDFDKQIIDAGIGDYKKEANTCINRLQAFRQSLRRVDRFSKVGEDLDFDRYLEKSRRPFKKRIREEEPRAKIIDLVIDSSGSMDYFDGYPILAAKAVTFLWMNVAEHFRDDFELRVFAVKGNDSKASITPMTTREDVRAILANGDHEGYRAYKKILDSETPPDLAFFLTDGDFHHPEDIRFLRETIASIPVCGIYVSPDPKHGKLSEFPDEIVLENLQTIGDLIMKIYERIRKESLQKGFKSQVQKQSQYRFR